MHSDFRGSLEHAQLEDSVFLTPGEPQKDINQSRLWSANLIRKREELKSCSNLEVPLVTPTTWHIRYGTNSHRELSVPKPNHSNTASTQYGYSQWC